MKYLNSVRYIYYSYSWNNWLFLKLFLPAVSVRVFWSSCSSLFSCLLYHLLLISLFCFLLFWTSTTAECSRYRSSCLELFLGKGVLKICSKSIGEHLYRSVISMKLLYWNRTPAWVFSCKFAVNAALLKSQFGISVLL